MDRKKRKKSNAGMSLLEVIVAVSIFSITAAVLLQSFVTSQRINKKSNLYLEATTVAQNIMEEIKSKDFEDVSLAFNYPINFLNGQARLSFLDSERDRINTETGNSIGVKEVIKDGSNYNDVRLYNTLDGEDTSKVTASVISKDEGKSYEFNPRKTGNNVSKYYFELTNVPGNHESFDALIEFNGGEGSGYKKKTLTNNDEGKNDYLAPNIAKLDTKTNAFLIMRKNWDNEMMKQIAEGQKEEAKKLWAEDLNNYTKTAKTEEEKTKLEEQFMAKYPEPQGLDPEDIYKQTRRTLYIKIEESGGTIKTEAKYVLNAYNYVKEGGNKYERMDICTCGGKSEEGQLNGCFCTRPSAYWTFYSSEAEAKLKNLYIFYYPNYENKVKNSTKTLDNIVIENENNYPINVYVTKQRDEENNIPTSSQENFYRMSLTIKECPDKLEHTNWNTNTSLYKAQTKLRTNLDYNISGFEQILTRPRINQMQLTYQAVNDKGENGKKKTGTAAKQILSYNGLDDKTETDRIYTAKVKVYKSGAAEKGFPEDELVASLDGAKEN